jgi:hypothetical protein
MCRVKVQGREHLQTKRVYDETIAKSRKAFWESPIQLGLMHHKPQDIHYHELKIIGRIPSSSIEEPKFERFLHYVKPLGQILPDLGLCLVRALF